MGPIVLSSQTQDQLEIVPSCGVLEILIKPSKGLRKEKQQPRGCFHEAWGLGPGVHWICHLVSSCTKPRHLPLWRSGRLSGKGLHCRLIPSFQRCSGPSRFYSPKPSDIQVLDGGSSDARVITFTQTNMTNHGVAQEITKEPADQGHHCTETHRDVQPKRGPWGTVPAPASTVRASPQSSLSFQ